MSGIALLCNSGGTMELLASSRCGMGLFLFTERKNTMIKVTLKDGIVKEYEQGITIGEIAKNLGSGLYKASCAGKINGELSDLRTPVTEDCAVEILTFDSEDGKKTFWHTASHVLAQAVTRLYPNAKYAMGPAIDNGFYYDFQVEKPFTPEELEKINKEMAKIVSEGALIERFELDRAEALELMKDQPYKIELINEHSANGEKVSFYKQGNFVDLCAGPHLISTAPLKAIKLTQCTGAYWRGDAENDMLCRVYGTAFPKAAPLEEYLAAVEEAKKRDHNKIGRELKLFTTVDYIGQGLPILLPKGAKIVQTLQRFVEDEEERRGYQRTRTPLMAKSDLYSISGHWQHYRDGMFVLGDEEKDSEVFALRPMTCPFQFQAFLADMRSYRDLPMRLGETATLFRNESSGEMHGLIRVRQFTISEGHIICTPDQLEAEFVECLDLARYMMRTLGLEEDVSYCFSKWDPNNKGKYIGSPEQWETIQDQMRDILQHLDLDFYEAEGEAAFYGPKLDIQIKNVHGKEDTLITIQIDFQLAERFGMEYIDSDGTKKFPYIIHRTALGCYERTLALLIEKYAGAFPLWLAPVQAKIIPISDKQADYAKDMEKKLRAAGFIVETDLRNEKMGYKIREAQLEKIPYMLVVGDKEMEAGAVAIRSRKHGDMGTMDLDSFIAQIKEELETRAL